MNVIMGVFFHLCLFAMVTPALLFSKPLTPVSLQLQWKHQFEFAGYYAAKHKGFYAEAGLDVTLKEFEAGTDIVKDVTDGKSTFGTFYSSLIKKRIDGAPVVMLANYIKRSPLVLAVRPDIYYPGELRGKKIMGLADELISSSFAQMFERFDIAPNDYTAIPHSITLDPFINGEVDAMTIFLTNEAYELQESKVPYNILDPSNYGVPFYEANLFTSEAFAKAHPLTVRSFVDASKRGWEYALDHPEEIIELIVQRYNSQHKSREHLRFEAHEIERLMMRGNYPVGSIDPNRIVDLANIYLRGSDTARTFDPGGFLFHTVDPAIKFTDEEKAFLEKHRTLRVHNESNFYPYNFNENDRPAGYSVDYLNLLAHKLGMRIKYVAGHTWNDYLQMLQGKELDAMLNISPTPERSAFANFTPSYIAAIPAIYTNDPGISSLKDLEGRTIAVPEGFFFQELLESYYPGVRLHLVKDNLAAIEALTFGQADALLSDTATAHHLMQMHGIERPAYVIRIDDRRFTAEGAIGVRSDWPLMRDILTKAMHSVTVEENDALRNKWFSTRDLIQYADLADLTTAEKEHLQEMQTVRMCVDPDWMPFESIQDGKHVGMAAEYMQLIERKIGIPLTLVPSASWSDSIATAKARRCDIFSLAMETPERQAYMHFTTPYLHVPLVVAARNNAHFVADIEQVLDKPLGIVKGYAFMELLTNRYPGTNFIEVETMDDGLAKVASGELYGFIGTLYTVGYKMQKRFTGELKIIGKFDETWDMGIGVRNDDLQLLAVMQKAIASITPAQHQRISNNWLAITYEKGKDYTLLWQSGLIVLALLVFILWRLYVSRRYNRSLTELNARLEEMSKTDALTGLNNRRHIEALLASEIERSRRYGIPLSVILLDIDDFKQINDVYGHNEGDSVLSEIALILRTETRSSDAVGRWGGEEFLILCPHTTLEQAGSLAEKLRSYIDADDYELPRSVTASFGVAELMSHHALKDLVRVADDALYDAKRNGKNRVSKAGHS